MSHPPIELKICGVTNLRDGELAVELGAWALGMIFFDGSPRRCSHAAARQIAAGLRREVQLCGVFVNATMDEVLAHCEQFNLALVQLHGDEGPAFCREVARRSGARVIKALQVEGAGDIRQAERFRVDYHLLDTRSRASGDGALRGGTGERFDWSLLQARRSRVPLILSGGITAENAEQAIEAAERRRLFALDVASGVESAPGRKDPERLRALFAAVERANAARAERLAIRDAERAAAKAERIAAGAGDSATREGPAEAIVQQPASLQGMENAAAHPIVEAAQQIVAAERPSAPAELPVAPEAPAGQEPAVELATATAPLERG